jgi:hypothetical protein
MQEERFLDRVEASQYLADKGLRISPKTLQKFATVGGGPAYQRFGGRAVYRASGLNAWIEQRLSAPSHTAPAQRKAA